jgi:hypothetical protein
VLVEDRHDYHSSENECHRSRQDDYAYTRVRQVSLDSRVNQENGCDVTEKTNGSKVPSDYHVQYIKKNPPTQGCYSNAKDGFVFYLVSHLFFQIEFYL